MRKSWRAVTVGLIAATALIAPGSVTAAAALPESGPAACLAGVHAAVLQDNDSFEARDAERYAAVLHPDLVVDRGGRITYGKEAHLEGALAFFKVPGWHWRYTIIHEEVFGCSTGIALLDVHQIDATKDYHAHVAMTLTRYHGKWVVAMDYVQLLSTTEL